MIAGPAAAMGGNTVRKAGNLFSRSPRIIKGVALAAIAGAVVGRGTGYLDRIENMFDTGVYVQAGRGTVTSVFPLSESCYGGYDTKVDNAKAEWKFSLGSLTLINSSAVYNGTISTVVCNKNDLVPIKTMYTGNRRHVTITVPPESFTTHVTQADPTNQNNYKYEHNIVAGAGAAVADIVKGLPVVGKKVNGFDPIQNILAGTAYVAASETAVDGCAQKAWGLLKTTYDEQMATAIANYANALDQTDAPITAADVTVNSPAVNEIQFANPYKTQLTNLQKAAEGSGITYSIPDPNKLTCEAAADVRIPGGEALQKTR